MSTRLFSTDESLNTFGHWITSHGGFIHPSLTFTPPDPEYGSQLLTTSALPLDSRLVSCPHTLAIDYSKARATFPENFLANTTRHAALCIFLVAEQLKGKASLWWPYLRILPREFGTPLYFSDEDLAYLQGCNLDRKEVDKRRAAWREEFEAAMASLENEGRDTSGYSWSREMYLWSATVFTSRSFPGRLLSQDPQAARADDDAPVLFPLIDSLNHYPLTKITWETSSSSLSIICGEEIVAGKEVHNNYGPKSNEELLLSYGFTLKNNPFDTVHLKFSPPPTQTQTQTRDPETIYHLSPRNHPSIYPAHLLTHIHNLTLTPHERSKPTHTQYTKRNQISTHTTLLTALLPLLHTQTNHPAPLPPPRTQNQAHAKTYADAQRTIIRAAVSESKDVIRKLGTNTLTLRTALADRIFADATEACFGTRDVREIRGAGLEDMVIVLYLCYLSLTDSDVPVSLLVGPESTSGGLDLDVGAEAWELHEDLFPAAADAAPGVFGGPGWTVELLQAGMDAYADFGVRIPAEGGVEMEYGVCFE